jgi:membrane-bound serine protease (ClpP class)
MKKLLQILFLFSIVLGQNIYHIKITQEIEPGLVPYIKRGIQEAKNNNAQAIIFEINTFGGRVDAAVQIRDEIINTKIPTVAFINKRAISAGALISIACKKIVMSPASTIGAATVVDMEGKKQSEKYQSYMRAEMRATAEKNGRNPIYAQAMVDETIKIPDSIKGDNKLLTFTAEEAYKYKYNDTILESINQIPQYLNIKNYQIIPVEKNNMDSFISFISNPVVVSILLTIGIIGIITEIKTPGFGVPGIVGLIALALIFGTNYITNIANSFEIILFIIGIVLIILEIFVIPGFGLTGVIGFLMVVGSLFLILLPPLKMTDGDLINKVLFQITLSFIFSGIVLYFLSKYLPKNQTFNKLILDEQTSVQAGFTSADDYSYLLNKIGIAHTVLRPAGIVIIDDKKYNVVTTSDYIDKGTKVKVIKIEGNKIIVENIQ